MHRTLPTVILALVLVGVVATWSRYYTPQPSVVPPPVSQAVSSDYWRDTLTPAQYHVLREGGTERPYTGALNKENRKGTYFSVGCDKPLFRSEQKYDSGTGWPSFWAPITSDALELRKESGPLDDRIEVLDSCGSHLGHVFSDGPLPTGKRFCMNSVALYFVPDEE